MHPIPPSSLIDIFVCGIISTKMAKKRYHITIYFPTSDSIIPSSLENRIQVHALLLRLSNHHNCSSILSLHRLLLTQHLLYLSSSLRGLLLLLLLDLLRQLAIILLQQRPRHLPAVSPFPTLGAGVEDDFSEISFSLKAAVFRIDRRRSIICRVRTLGS